MTTSRISNSTCLPGKRVLQLPLIQFSSDFPSVRRTHACLRIFKIVSTVVDPLAQLENSGCDASRLRGFPHVRRGESAFTEILYHQARELCISIKLHEAGTMGNRLRHVRRRYPSNYTAQQESVSSATRRLPGRLVSILNAYSIRVKFSTVYWSGGY